MNKQERKNLLERMIAANDAMSSDKPGKAYDYAECLMQLFTSKEYDHAQTLWKTARAEENLVASQDMRREYENDLEIEIRERQEREVFSLQEASIESLKYFLGSDIESHEFLVPQENK